MRLPYLATSLTVAVITRQAAGLGLLHALSNVFDDGRKSIEKVVSDITAWDLGHDIPVLLDEGRETLDKVLSDITHLDFPALLSGIVPESSLNSLRDLGREAIALFDATSAVFHEIQRHGATSEETQVLLQALFDEVREIMNAHFPPLDSAAGHEERMKALHQLKEPFLSGIESLGVPTDIAENLWTDLISSVGEVGIALLDFYNLHPDLVLAVVAALTESYLPSLVGELGLLSLFEIERALPILQAIGFSKNGIVKGSITTWIQRMLYSLRIPKESLFSWLQSIAMGRSP